MTIELNHPDLPAIGSVWCKPAWTDRTIVAHRYNAWGKCWWIKLQHAQGTMEIPLSKWLKWRDGARQKVASST